VSGVTILLDEVTPLLESVTSLVQARGLALVGARATASLVKEHAYGLNGERHRSGGRNFYRQAADSVSTAAVSQGAVVSINQQGFRQRLYGGAIRPGAGKTYLTLPACDEAYGKRAGEFPGLKFAYALDPKSGALRPALVRPAGTAVKIGRKKAVTSLQPEVLFWLVRKVDQRADPTVLPYGEQMSAVAVAAIRTRFSRLALRNARAGGTQDPA
jgi:hypothetical protein